MPNDDEFYAAQNAGFGVDTPAPVATTTPPTEQQDTPEDAEIPPSSGKPDGSQATPQDGATDAIPLEEGVVTATPDDPDWRVRLSLAPGATYLYKDQNNQLLQPLAATGGVIFPYTPSINITYGANYSTTSLAHSNYKIYQYENSSVDNITITCDFTAQDRVEANYLLAVIHFFKSITKMFYSLDNNPPGGTPPPLCFLTGFGKFQFSDHPVVINSFNYNLPTDVDYIRAGLGATNSAVYVPPSGGSETPKPSLKAGLTSSLGRLAQGAVAGMGATASGIFGKLLPGGITASPSSLKLNAGFNSLSKTDIDNATYVPTKISLTIGAYPVMSRYDMSNRFSLSDYAKGQLPGVW